MSKTIELDIPDAPKRARLSVIRAILTELTTHNLTMDQAAHSIADLIAVEIMQAIGRTKAGNDIGGI